MKRSDRIPADASFHHRTGRPLLTDVFFGEVRSASVDATSLPTVAMCSGVATEVDVTELSYNGGLTVLGADVARVFTLPLCLVYARQWLTELDEW